MNATRPRAQNRHQRLMASTGGSGGHPLSHHHHHHHRRRGAAPSDWRAALREEFQLQRGELPPPPPGRVRAQRSANAPRSTDKKRPAATFWFGSGIDPWAFAATVAPKAGGAAGSRAQAEGEQQEEEDEEEDEEQQEQEGSVRKVGYPSLPPSTPGLSRPMQGSHSRHAKPTPGWVLGSGGP
jgi:hypothetical protein